MDDNISLVTGAKKQNNNYDLKNDVEKCIESFASNILESKDAIKKKKDDMITMAQNGQITNNHLRPFAWKIFLNLLPVSQNDSLEAWIKAVIDQRALAKKKFKAVNCLKKLAGDPLGGSLNTNTKAAGWDSFFEDSEVKKIINLDVNRTYQDQDLFCTPLIKDLLCNILFLWAKENKEPSYRQGMNEILAMFVFSLYPYYYKNPYQKDQKDITTKMKTYIEDPLTYKKELYHFFNDEAEFQNDIYWLFDKIMKQGASRFFETLKLEQVKVQGNSDIYLNKRCFAIINDKLQIYDKELYNHFVRIEIDCQIFLQRWLKCLFNREFHPANVVVIWDGILASEKKNESTGLVMVDYIAVGMITYMRKELLKQDQNECFSRLFTYPPMESPLTLVTKSFEIERIILNQPPIINEPKNELKHEPKKEPKKEPKHEPNKMQSILKEHDKTTNKQVPISSPSTSNSSTSPNTTVTPVLNGNIVHARNEDLLAQIDIIFRKYKSAMNMTDIANYQLALDTLKKNLSNK